MQKRVDQLQPPIPAWKILTLLSCVVLITFFYRIWIIKQVEESVSAGTGDFLRSAIEQDLYQATGDYQ